MSAQNHNPQLWFPLTARSPRPRNATIPSLLENEILSEAIAAGVDFLEEEVLLLVEAEQDRFEMTILELFDVMRRAQRSSHTKTC